MNEPSKNYLETQIADIFTLTLKQPNTIPFPDGFELKPYRLGNEPNDR